MQHARVLPQDFPSGKPFYQRDQLWQWPDLRIIENNLGRASAILGGKAHHTAWTIINIAGAGLFCWSL